MKSQDLYNLSQYLGDRISVSADADRLLEMAIKESKKERTFKSVSSKLVTVKKAENTLYIYTNSNKHIIGEYNLTSKELNNEVDQIQAKKNMKMW